MAYPNPQIHRAGREYASPVRSKRAILTAAALALAALLAFTQTASARDPGRWVLTGASSIPMDYWQGLTNNPDASNIFFIGPAQGLWQTTPQLAQTAGVDKEIPTDLRHDVGYNHIGDPTWLAGEGGRIVLPMECFNPSANPSNTCGKGAFGIANPQTLAFRYYVQLDPNFIPKAMWAETSPDGRLIWTSSGNDLIAYRATRVSQANAAPSGPQLDPVKRLRGAVPPTGVTGAVFRQHRLLLAGESNHTYQVWAVNTQTGRRQLKLEMHICGESEGLGLFTTLGGRLHWLIAPSDSGCELTFGPTSALLHFRPSPGHKRFYVTVNSVSESAATGPTTRRVRIKARVTRHGGKPVSHANVRFAGAAGRTNRHGRATVSTTLETPGRFAIFARKGTRYGTSSLVGFDVSGPARATRPSRG
jgi:hypothetical protein